MILDDLKTLKTGARDLRKFGVLVGGVFAVIGVLCALRGRSYYPWFLIPGGGLVLFGLALPRALKQVYIAWMSVAIVLGFIVSNVILTLFFFLVITPVGLLARWFGKDFLSRKLQRETKTYWIPRRPRPAAPVDYEKQF